MPYKTVTAIDTGEVTAEGFKIIKYPGIDRIIDRPYTSELAKIKKFWEDVRKGESVATEESKKMFGIIEKVRQLYNGDNVEVASLQKQIQESDYLKWILLPLMLPNQTAWCLKNFLADEFTDRVKVERVLAAIINVAEYQHLFYSVRHSDLVSVIQFLGRFCKDKPFSLYGLFRSFYIAMNCINELIRYGFDPNCKDPLFGGQYVDSLLANEHADNALALLKVLDQPTCHYNYANQSRENARTLLMWAVAIGAHGVVDHLLGLQRRGIDIGINKQDHRGRTAAHLAAALGYGDILQKLQVAGADPKLKDLENRSITDYAALTEPATRELLNDFGIHPDRSEHASHNYLYGLDSGEMPVLYWRGDQTEADATLVLLAPKNIAIITAAKNEVLQSVDPLDDRVNNYFQHYSTIKAEDKTVIEAVMLRRQSQLTLTSSTISSEPTDLPPPPGLHK